MKREHGFTLVELMVHCTLLALFTVTLAMLSHTWQQAERTSRAFSQDLTESRRALHRLEEDLRRASSIEQVGESWTLRSKDSELRWVLEDGNLTRHDGKKSHKIAQCIQKLELVEDGPFAKVALYLAPRARKESHAVLRTRIRLRNFGQGS